jgi:hypothetical protein
VGLPEPPGADGRAAVTEAGAEPARDPESMLLEFVRERDVSCPACGYNLRNLSRPVCPECREPLSLKVTHELPPIGPFVALLAPSIFSALLAVVLLSLTFIFGGPPAEVIMAIAFGVLNAILILIIFGLRRRFVRSPRRVQIGWAGLNWLVHLTVFIVFMVRAA